MTPKTVFRFLAIATTTFLLSGLCLASPFIAVPGITGTDGSLPIVEGTTAVVSGLPLFATGGDVTAYFAGFSADDWDLIYNGFTPIALNQTSALGSKVDLGVFAAGTPITFEMLNINTGQIFETGPGSSNPDGNPHAAYAPWMAYLLIPANGLFISFEDLLYGAKISLPPDFDDADIVATGVRLGPATPEPATYILTGVGLGLLGFIRRSQNRTSRNMGG